MVCLKCRQIVSLMQTSISLNWKPNLPHVHQEGSLYEVVKEGNNRSPEYKHLFIFLFFFIF